MCVVLVDAMMEFPSFEPDSVVRKNWMFYYISHIYHHLMGAKSTQTDACRNGALAWLYAYVCLENDFFRARGLLHTGWGPGNRWCMYRLRNFHLIFHFFVFLRRRQENTQRNAKKVKVWTLFKANIELESLRNFVRKL